MDKEKVLVEDFIFIAIWFEVEQSLETGQESALTDENDSTLVNECVQVETTEEIIQKDPTIETKEIEAIDESVDAAAKDYTFDELDQVSVVESESICSAIAAIDDTSDTSFDLESVKSEVDEDDQNEQIGSDQ